MDDTLYADKLIVIRMRLLKDDVWVFRFRRIEV